MIGLISALEEEIALLKENLENERIEIFSGLEFRLGRLGEQEVVLLRCGVGKVNAAMATQVLIDRFGVEAVIFTGLAGALVSHLNPGDVVVSSSVVQYDIDLTAFGRRPGEIPDLNRMFDADSRLVHAACDAFEATEAGRTQKSRLQVGTVATGDTFVSDPDKIRWLQREFGAVATEMEGGAVGQVCHMNRVPFVVIRIISDSASGGAAGEFIIFLGEAAKLSYEIIDRLIDNMAVRDTTK